MKECVLAWIKRLSPSGKAKKDLPGSKPHLIRDFIGNHRFEFLVLVSLMAINAGATVVALSSIGRLAASDLYKQGDAALFQGAIALGLAAVTGLSSQYTSSALGARFVAHLRDELSGALISTPYEKLAFRGGSLIGTFIHDISKLAPLAMLLPMAAYNILICIVCLCYLSYLSPSLFGLFIVVTMPLSLASWLWSRRSWKQFGKLRESENAVFEHIQTIASGAKEITLNRARANHFRTSVLRPAIDCSREIMNAAHLELGVEQSLSSLGLYITLFVIVCGAYVLRLPPKTAVAFSLGGFFLLGPLGALLAMSQQMASGWASLQSIENLNLEFSEARPKDDLPNTSARRSLSNWRTICLKNVRYRYPSQPGTELILGPFDLEVRRGEILFITGENGAGKSTLLLLLCGLLSPTSGCVSIDGETTNDLTRQFMDLFSGVFGNFHLFRHVLNGAGEAASDSDCAVILQQLKLSSEVQIVSGELSRVALSTGQSKRVALLQCLTEDRGIFLFDEWAADQDPAFKRYFYEHLLPELKAAGKTAVVVSHDDRFFGAADRIIEVKNGLIVSNNWSALPRLIHPH